MQSQLLQVRTLIRLPIHFGGFMKGTESDYSVEYRAIEVTCLQNEFVPECCVSPPRPLWGCPLAEEHQAAEFLGLESREGADGLK
jgi:hypothetical protein